MSFHEGPGHIQNIDLSLTPRSISKGSTAKLTPCPVPELCTRDAHVDHPSCIMLGPRQSLSQSPEILAPRKKVVSGAEISLTGAGVRDGASEPGYY